MKSENDNSAYYPEQISTFNYKKFYYSLVRKWHWFTVFIFIGVLGAWLYNHFASPEYSIHSSLIINEYESGIKKYNLTQGASEEQQVNILGQDYPGRLKSYILNLNTLQNLGWNVCWYQKTLLYSKDLYGNEPYRIILISDKKNLTDIPVFIKRISDTEYEVEAEPTKDGITLPVKLSQRGKFGEPFVNQYFAFILVKTGDQPAFEKDVYFVVNNLNSLALKYQKKLKIIYNEQKPDIMELILTENNPERGVAFLNALEQTYIDYGLAEKNRVAENTMKFIDSQLKNVTDSLSYSENRVTSFRSRIQSVDLNQEGGIFMQKKETLESDRVALENRLEYLRNLRDEMNDSRQMKQVIVPSAFGITDQTMNSLVAKLTELYSQRERLTFSVKEKAPQLIQLDADIHLTYSTLLLNVNALINSSERDLASVMQRAGGFSSELSLLPKKEQLSNSLKRNYDLNNDLYSYLLRLRAESAITYASNQPDVKVMDPANIETTMQTGPMSLVNYLIGIILGFLFPFGIIMFKDYINRTIQSKDEIEELTTLPIAGMIIHNNSRKNMVVYENPRSNITESFRLLRTNLKYFLSGEDKKIFAIQSYIPGEGKSFIALNLASILAVNNFKVLLVGVDMRMSTLHDILKSDNSTGLSNYLINQDSFENIIESTPITNLSYVPSGPVPPNPAELLENGNFEQFIKEAKSRFDYVILDCPPISIVAEGIITGRYADINLFVLRFRYSSREQIKFINEFELKKMVPNPALILNDAVKDNFGSGGYYSYKNKGYYGE